jgi:hypothetical protein
VANWVLEIGLLQATFAKSVAEVDSGFVAVLAAASEHAIGSGVRAAAATAQLGEECTALKAAAGSPHEVAAAFAADVSGRIATFAADELKADVATGRTPAKQSYGFSRTLPSTAPYEVLVEEFHASPQLLAAALDEGGEEGAVVKAEGSSSIGEGGAAAAAHEEKTVGTTTVTALPTADATPASSMAEDQEAAGSPPTLPEKLPAVDAAVVGDHFQTMMGKKSAAQRAGKSNSSPAAKGVESAASATDLDTENPPAIHDAVAVGKKVESAMPRSGSDAPKALGTINA